MDMQPTSSVLATSQNGKNVKKTDDSLPEVDSDTHFRCGWFCFEPQCCQCFASALWVCLCLTVGNTFISGTYNGLSGSAQTSIETRFGLTSAQSSWIVTSYDISNILTGVALIFLCSKQSSHKPRWIAAGLVTASVGCIIYTLPHFISDVYQPGELNTNQDITCSNKTGQEDVCESNDVSKYSARDVLSDQAPAEMSTLENNKYMGVFIVARMLLGCGAAPMHLLGLTFLDDCSTKSAFSFYSGTTSSFPRDMTSHDVIAVILFVSLSERRHSDVCA